MCLEFRHIFSALVIVTVLFPKFQVVQVFEALYYTVVIVIHYLFAVLLKQKLLPFSLT